MCVPLTPPTDTRGSMTIHTFSSLNLITQPHSLILLPFDHSIASTRGNQLRTVIAIIAEMERTKKREMNSKPCALLLPSPLSSLRSC